MSKPVKPKTKKYSVVLNECELRRLTVYAAKCGVDRPTALARLLRRSLREAAEGIAVDDEQALNQLGLFDSVQIDIFNNTSKV